MNVLRKISIDTVLLWLAVALCVGVLALMGGAAAGLAAIGIVGAAVARGAPPSCPSCGGSGNVASDEPFMMMAAVPCPTCSPPAVGVALAEVESEEPESDSVRTIERKLGEKALCKGCGLPIFRPGSTGCGDDMPDHCDPCWTISHQSHGRAALPLESPSQDPPRSDDGNAKSARDPARAPLDIATLRSLAQSAAHRVAKAGPPTAWEKGVYGALTAAREDVPILASAVEQLADALEAKAKAQPRARLDADATTPELPADSALIGLDDSAGIFGATTVDVPALYDQIERQAAEIATLREAGKADRREMNMMMEWLYGASIKRDEQAARIASLEASVDLLDTEGRKMKAERDEALLEVAALKLSLGDARFAFADGEAHERRKRDVTIERLQSELDTARAEIERLKESLATACATGEPPTAEQHAELLDALAQIKALNSEIERMKPVVDLVGEWCQVADGTPEEDAIETRIIDAFGEYQEAGAL